MRRLTITARAELTGHRIERALARSLDDMERDLSGSQAGELFGLRL